MCIFGESIHATSDQCEWTHSNTEWSDKTVKFTMTRPMSTGEVIFEEGADYYIQSGFTLADSFGNEIEEEGVFQMFTFTELNDFSGATSLFAAAATLMASLTLF